MHGVISISVRTDVLSADADAQRRSERAVPQRSGVLQSPPHRRPYFVVRTSRVERIFYQERGSYRSTRRMGRGAGRRALSMVPQVEQEAPARARRAVGRDAGPWLFPRPIRQEAADLGVRQCLRVLRSAWTWATRRAFNSALSRRRRRVGESPARLSALQLHKGAQDCGRIRISILNREAR